MPQEDLHQEEESNEDIFDDTSDDTLDQGNDSDDTDEMSEADKAFLARVNEVEGRNYKTVDSYQKSVKNRNAEFAKKGNKQGSAQESVPQKGVLETLYFKATPNAKLVWDDVEEAAKELGKTDFQDKVKLFESSKYLQEEAQVKAKTVENGNKVGNPSTRVGGQTTTAEEKMEKKFSDPNTFPPGLRT